MKVQKFRALGFNTPMPYLAHLHNPNSCTLRRCEVRNGARLRFLGCGQMLSLRAETASSILGSCKSCDIMRIMHLLSHERCWSTSQHNLSRQRHPQLCKHVSPAKRQDFKTVRFLSSLFTYIIHPCHQPMQATHKQSAVVRASFGNGWPPKIPDAWPHPLLVWARAGSQTTIPNNSKHPKTQAMRRTPSSPERVGEWPDKRQISA